MGIAEMILPRLMPKATAAAFLRISVPAFDALGIQAKVIPPRTRRYDRLDLERISSYGIAKARRAVGELAPKRPHDVPSIVRSFVFERDQCCCQYCGATDGHLELDHVVPFSRGGTAHPDNLLVACRSCNQAKGSKTLGEWVPDRPVDWQIVNERASRIYSGSPGLRSAILESIGCG